MPGFTTIIIVATFVLTLFQLYKFVKNMLNSKVDLEDFQNTAHSYVDRTPLVSAGGPPNSRANRPSDDEYIQNS